MRKFLHKTLTSLANKLEVKSMKTGTLNDILTSYNTLYGLGYRQGIGWLSAIGAINYYCQVSPIANAVDLIAQKTAEIYTSIWDKKENKYIKENFSGTPYKVFDLLKVCNYNKTYTEFMKTQASLYLITGNCFFITKFLEKGEPIQLLMAKPQDIVIEGNGKNIANRYIWSNGDNDLTFDLDISNMRYYAKDKFGFTYELKHVKDFNPKEDEGNLWGMSKLTQIYLELEQHIQGAIHNKKLLTNGSRPSGVLTLDEEMSDDAYEKARAEVRNFYSGSQNAGNILIFEGMGTKFVPFDISPKDMDFATLSEKNTTAIYNRLNIPLAFISDKSLTYNNLSESLYQLYILSVIPLTELLLEALSDLILYRYKDGEQFEIHYDEMDIDVFARRKKEEHASEINLGITTMNEARGMFSLEPLAEGGDDVYTPMNLMPLGKPIEEKAITSKENFVSIMRKQRFSENRITEEVKRIYGN